MARPSWLTRERCGMPPGDPPRAGRTGPVTNGPTRGAPKRPRRIALFGLFGAGNSGNDASLEAMLGFLRRVRPDGELACICPAPAVVEQAFRLPAHSIGRPEFASAWGRRANRLLLRIPQIVASWFRTLATIRGYDLLIVPGTGILDDFGTGPAGFPYALFRWCLCARLCGTRLWFVSIGAGPIRHPVSRWLMTAAAAMAEYRSYRDAISREFVSGLGLDVRDEPVYPDLAFKLPVPYVPGSRRPGPSSVTIGVGVMAYAGWRGTSATGAGIYEAYLAKIARFVLWCLDRGHRVRILTGDAIDRRAVDDLMRVVSADRGAIPADRLVAEPTSSLGELMRQIAETDLVVATRFHNVVGALKLDRPTVSVGYARKNDVLLAEMGLDTFCQHIERLDVDLLIEQVTALISERAVHEQRIRAVNLVYERRLAHQDAVLASRLAGSPAPRP